MSFPFQDTGENIWVQKIKRYARSQYPPWETLPLLTRILLRIFGDYPLDHTMQFTEERGVFRINFQTICYKNVTYFYKFGGK